jgi:hypothetical protein
MRGRTTLSEQSLANLRQHAATVVGDHLIRKPHHAETLGTQPGVAALVALDIDQVGWAVGLNDEPVPE